MPKSVSLQKTLPIFAMSSCFSMLFLNESGAIAVTFPKTSLIFPNSVGVIMSSVDNPIEIKDRMFSF